MEDITNRINESSATVSTVGAQFIVPIKKDLPEGWVWRKIKDICNLINGRAQLNIFLHKHIILVYI
jgi:hypothetical protein